MGYLTAAGESQPRCMSWAPERETLGTVLVIKVRVVERRDMGLMHQQQVVHSSLTTKGKGDEGEKTCRIWLISSEVSLCFFSLNHVSKNYNIYVCNNSAVTVCKKWNSVFFCPLSPPLTWFRHTDLPYSYGTTMVQTLSSLGRKTKSINSDRVQKVIQGTKQKHLQPTAPQNPTPSFRHHNASVFHEQRNQHSI